jgi:hypothetical protein
VNEDHARLVAKIQHFYDYTTNRIRQLNDEMIVLTDAGEDNQFRLSTGGRLYELTDALKEYQKTFEELLYKDSHGKD